MFLKHFRASFIPKVSDTATLGDTGSVAVLFCLIARPRIKILLCLFKGAAHSYIKYSID